MENILGFTSIILAAILVLSPGSCYGSEMYISRSLKTWNASYLNCKLATPTIIYTDDAPKISADGSFDTMWVGYGQVTIAMLYVGCSEVSTLQNVTKFEAVKKDPGVCYSLCKTDYIGVSPKKRTCFCINSQDLPDSRTTVCTTACVSPPGALCGDADYDGDLDRVSLYQKVEYHVSDFHEPNQSNKICLAFKPVNKVLTWEPCTRPYLSMCVDNDTIIYTNKSHKSWKQSAETCLRARMLPVYKVPSSSEAQTKTQYWTGVIRVNATLPVDEIDTNSMSYRAGYIEWIDGSDMTLLFADVTSPETRKCMCVLDDKLSTTTQSSDDMLPKDGRTSYSIGPGNDVKGEHVTWTQANSSSSCQLDTPPIEFTREDPIIQYDGAEDGEMWVGYVQASIALLYVGCSNKSLLANSTMKEYVRSDPGVCFSLCRTDLIGINKGTCYCLASLPLPKDRTLKCDAECDTPTNVLCGAEDNDASLSIYRRVEGYAVSGNKYMNNKRIHCRAVKDRKYTWEVCNKGLLEMCNNSGTVVLINDSGSWEKAMESCLNKKTFPLDSKPPETNQTKQAWIGVIQVNTILSVKDFKDIFPAYTPANNTIQGGYIKWKGDKKNELQFDMVFTKRRKPLCVKGNESQSTASTPGDPNSSQYYNLSSTTFPTTQTGQKNASSGDSGEPARKSDEKDPNLTVVYISLGLAVVLEAIVVAIAVFCVRRKRSREQNHGKSDGTTSTAIVKHDMGSAYELSDYSECTYAHAGQPEQRGDDTYDTTNMTKPKPHNTDNIYNGLEDSAYGKFNPSKKNIVVSDGIYSHAMHKQNKKDDDNDEDTYNHVTQKSAHSDDTYSHMPQKFAKTDDTYGHVIKKPAQIDDTYSHVTQKSAKTGGAHGHVTQTDADTSDVYSQVVKKSPKKK